MVYERVSKKFNLTKKRVTSAKGNSRVNFPKDGGEYDEEAMMEMVRLELKGVFKTYCDERCMKGGSQKSNLTEAERRGQKSLKKRVADSEIVVVPTDKSGRFAVMSLGMYEKAGSAHTKGDDEVDLAKIKLTQNELNGHVSMLLKFFKIGEKWGHTSRFRETMLNNSLTVCPMYLLYKDHKGWDLSKGPVPPTRPVASGNRGMNMHLSELLSEVLEPVADGVEDTYEVISTEDMLAKMLIVDRSLEGWNKNKWWEGVKYDDYSACLRCVGEEGYKFDVANPELCGCEGSKDLFKPTSVMKTSVQFMEMMRQRRWLEITKDLGEDEHVDSNEVRPEMIQDFGVPLEIIGCDVNALYPSLDWGNTEEVIKEAIIGSNIEWEDVDILEGCRYIALNWDANECRRSKLRRILPVRRARTGVRPGVRGAGPLGPEIHDQEQWMFPEVVVTDEERKEVIATVISIATKELFSNHLYTFANKVYRQSKGGPIGHRATCAIARVTMNVWDGLWTRRLKEMNVKIETYTRYMDDGRTLLYPIRPGWRVTDDGNLKFCKRWEDQDRGLSTTERTKRVLEMSMRGVMRGIEMTMETKDDFGGEWLPTLDVSLGITEANRLKFCHFEKPTSSNLTLQRRSAMEHNVKVGILANEVIRRMLNIGGDIGEDVRLDVLDSFGTKLLTSGYSLAESRSIILSGVRGYEAKILRRRNEGSPLYRTAQESGWSRMQKKTVGKSTWFKGGKRTCAGLTGKGMKNGQNGKMKRGTGPLENIETRSVMFVEHTRDGELAKRLREQLGRMENVMGFRIKVVERTGTKIKDMFSLTNVWGGSQCGREDCTTCTQGGEEIPDCTRRSVLYESICTKCNSGARDAGPLKVPNSDVPSIYVGESSRSIYERAGEHWRAYQKKNTDSHIWKHHLLHHNGEGEPEMIFKVVGTFRTALARQIMEAVRIRGRGKSVLNSKGEYDRCKIHRLTIGSDALENIGTEYHQDDWNSGNNARVGEEALLERRKHMDIKTRGRNVLKPSMGGGKKRGMDEIEGPGRKSKKRKYVLLGGNWGQRGGMKECGQNLKIEDSTGPLEEHTEELRLLEGPEAAGNGTDDRLRNMVVAEMSTSPVLVDMTVGNSSTGPFLDEEGASTRPIVNTVGQSGILDYCKPRVIRNEDKGEMMFDMANNVNTLREMRGTCRIVSGRCQEHSSEVKRVTQTKMIWTRNLKTGLYGYRRRKVSVLRCLGHMATLVVTMGERDSTGLAGD